MRIVLGSTVNQGTTSHNINVCLRETTALRRRGERWPFRKDSPPTDCCVFSFRWSLPSSHVMSKGLLTAISNEMGVSGWVDRDTDVKVNLQNFLFDPEGHIKPSDFRLVLVHLQTSTHQLNLTFSHTNITDLHCAQDTSCLDSHSLTRPFLKCPRRMWTTKVAPATSQTRCR